MASMPCPADPLPVVLYFIGAVHFSLKSSEIHGLRFDADKYTGNSAPIVPAFFRRQWDPPRFAPNALATALSERTLNPFGRTAQSISMSPILRAPSLTASWIPHLSLAAFIACSFLSSEDRARALATPLFANW